MKMKPITGIALTLFLASTLTIAFDLLPISGQEVLWSYPTGSSGIRDVMVSTNGSLVATGTVDGRILGIREFGSRIWESLTAGALLSADMPDDGRYIVAASADNFLYFLDGATGSIITEWMISPRTVDVTSGGEYIAVIHSINTVSLLSEGGGTVWNGIINSSDAETVSVSDDGRYVAVAGKSDNTVYFFGENGTLLWSHLANDAVLRVDTSVDGDYVAFGSLDKNVYFFDRTGDRLWTNETVNQVNPVTISTDERYVAAGTGAYEGGSDDYYIYLFDRIGENLWRYPTLGTIWDVAISPDSRYVVAGSEDNSIYFLDIEGKLIDKYDVGSPVYSVSISSDGNYVAVASDSEVFLFNAPPAQARLNIEVVGSGSTVPAPGNYMYDEGTVVDVTAFPDSGWMLDHWELNGSDVGSANPYSVIMDASQTLAAVFADGPTNQYTLLVRVRDNENNPVEAASVILDAEFMGETDVEGELNVYNLTKGIHIILVTKEGYQDKEVEIDVTSNIIMPVTLNMEANQPPTAYIDSIEPSSATVGEEITFIGHGTDPDGEIVSYRWRSGIDELLSSSDSFSTPGLSAGTHTISFQVQDNNGVWSDEATQSLVINPFEDNKPPSISVPSWIPEVPSEDEETVIEVSVVDEASGVEIVTLCYSISGEEWEDIPMEFSEGIWTATIPAQEVGTIVEFYIESYDSVENYAVSEIFSYEVPARRQAISLYVLAVAAAGVTAALGTAVAVAKIGVSGTGKAIGRMARRIKGKKVKTKEREERRRRKRKEKPKLVWTFTPSRKIRSGGHGYVNNEIKNVGKAPATGVELRIRGPPELKCDSPLKIGDINRNVSKRLRVKIECREKVPEGKRSLMFTLTSNETRPETRGTFVRFEPLRVGLLKDTHHMSYLQKQGKGPTSPEQLQAWLEKEKFDYGVVDEAENLGALQNCHLIIASSQYALSNKDVANLKYYVQGGRGLAVLDGVGTINADAFLRREPSYEGEKRVYDLYGYSRPDLASIEKGLKGLRIVENTHPITRGYKKDTLLRLPTQTGIIFTQPVLTARMLADQRVSVKGRPGYIGVPCLTVREFGKGRVVHFNFHVESVIGVISPLVEEAILWAASFE